MTDRSVKLYLLDIEGTVAPIAFVTQALFPYARAHFPAFLRENYEDADVRADLALLAQENSAETDTTVPHIAQSCRRSASGLPAFVPTSLEYLHWLMDHDRKSTALKSLQGRIWKRGYERGELSSVIFEDVPQAMACWSKQARVAIYSSGSAEAQELFFRYSNCGDLTPMISGYFDTRIGPKQACASYAAIAEGMQVAAADMLFFSDVVRELDAAREAGCATRLVVREGNAPVDETRRHPSVRSLRCVAAER